MKKETNTDSKVINQCDYDEYIDEVQKDYTKQIEKIDKWFKILSTIRALCILIIPFILVFDIETTKYIIALVSVVASCCEFYLKFKDYEGRLNSLNKASIALTYEFNMYSERADRYSDSDIERSKRMYVVATSNIIKEADMSTGYNTREANKVIGNNKSAR